VLVYWNLATNYSDWLEKVLKATDGKPVPKLVTVVNPGNPTGTYVPEPLLQVFLFQ
jgi:katanin p60 ATPase-containing subunit A1